ncbi:MAG: DAPG hydrolase family protein [Gammaproteobacteria bacterium]|tara:strand:- start:36 stop:791 length:756 start_codon:yes stop_codon:yes gene_type:complete
MDLSKYKLPLDTLPIRAIEIIEQEVIESEFIDFKHSQELVGKETIGDGVYKNKEHSYFIKCTTDMVNANPQMIGWWFAWHLPFSERYKLWHPRDHISARLKEEQNSMRFKDQYIGIDSYVEEYIGSKLQKLKITFQDPSHFGLHSDHNSIAICASVVDAITGIRVAKILHFVIKIESGAVMKSYFWIGAHLSHQNTLKSLVISKLSKIKFIKGFFINDNSAKNLLIHCYEEMNHLSKFLPDLYREYNAFVD